MPLFTRELNAIADYIGRANLRIWLHTAAPTNGSPTNGRTSVGGGAYEAGKEITAAQLTAAMNGDIESNIAIAFGTADEAVGTITHWSAVRGADAVGWGTLPSTVMGNGDTFTINSGALDFMGSTT